jgi:hypothetical protein
MMPSVCFRIDGNGGTFDTCGSNLEHSSALLKSMAKQVLQTDRMDKVGIKD